MNSNRFLFTIGLLGWCVYGLQAQPNVVVNFKGGSSQVIILNSIRSLSFSGGNMVFNKEDRTTESFPIQTINNFRVEQNLVITKASFAQENDLAGQMLDPTVYPNPMGDVVNVNFKLKNEGWVDVELISLNGAVLVSQRLEANAGENKASFSLGSNQPSGTYLLRVRTENELKTLKLIK